MDIKHSINSNPHLVSLHLEVIPFIVLPLLSNRTLVPFLAESGHQNSIQASSLHYASTISDAELSSCATVRMSRFCGMQGDVFTIDFVWQLSLSSNSHERRCGRDVAFVWNISAQLALWLFCLCLKHFCPTTVPVLIQQCCVYAYLRN